MERVGALLKPKRPGDPITAKEWNALVRLASREVRGSNVIADSNGWLILPSKGGGGTSVWSAPLALITSKIGSSPPYRYAAVAATMDIDGVWSEVEGGAAYNNVFNAEEQGEGGQWVNPLNVGDGVAILTPEGAEPDVYVCMRGHYRGSW